MKLDKKELMRRVAELIEDDDKKISILEDLDDSITEEASVENVMSEQDKNDYEELKLKYEDLKNRYKERFLSDDTKEEKIEDEEKIDEEVIDVKEI